MPFRIGDLVIYRAIGHFHTGYIARVGKTVAVNTHRYDEDPLHTRVKLEDCRPFDRIIWDEINLLEGTRHDITQEFWSLTRRQHNLFQLLPPAEGQP